MDQGSGIRKQGSEITDHVSRITDHIHDLIVLRTFAYEHEARIAQAALEAHGIPSMLKSDSAAGMLTFVHGIRLAVRGVDRDRAARIVTESA